MAAVVGEKDEKLEAEPGATKPVEMLEPGKNIRPIMTLEQARQLIQTLYGLEVSARAQVSSKLEASCPALRSTWALCCNIDAARAGNQLLQVG